MDVKNDRKVKKRKTVVNSTTFEPAKTNRLVFLAMGIQVHHILSLCVKWVSKMTEDLRETVTLYYYNF